MKLDFVGSSKKETLDEIALKMSGLSYEQVCSELEVVVQRKDYDPLAVALKALELCYRRDACEVFGLNYSGVGRKDFDRARLAAYYILKK